MQQTFNDLCKEWQADRGWFVFVLWTFAETTAGIMKEHTLLVAEGVAMKNMHANPQIRTLGSAILCLPATIILFIDMVAHDLPWPLPISLDVVGPVALLLLPVGIIISGAPIWLAAFLGFLTVLPFAILEVVNRWNYNEDFLVTLFIFLWIMPVMFFATLLSMVRSLRAENRTTANSVFVLLGTVLLVSLAWQWRSWVVNEMPCFLGAPNC